MNFHDNGNRKYVDPWPRDPGAPYKPSRKLIVVIIAIAIAAVVLVALFGCKRWIALGCLIPPSHHNSLAHDDLTPKLTT